ncbi:hypothetical protein CEXT_654111 [Caerostris extrusa]|uniref:Uncharacterized protein n=1 Tax=Caerostris extrusa TaxID=172846 RepID=A0AAV4RX05_CAEEX|nr:hypothetical protein CEXT_654111 [Caerostris extrusa]
MTNQKTRNKKTALIENKHLVYESRRTIYDAHGLQLQLARTHSFYSADALAIKSESSRKKREIRVSIQIAISCLIQTVTSLSGHLEKCRTLCAAMSPQIKDQPSTRLKSAHK